MSKHHDQSLGEERISVLQFSGSNSSLRDVRAGTWEQELVQRPWRVLLTDLFPVTCSVCFLGASGTTSTGVALPTVSCVLPQSSTKEKPTGFPTGKSGGDILSIGAPSFKITLACAKLPAQSPRVPYVKGQTLSTAGFTDGSSARDKLVVLRDQGLKGHWHL